MTKLQWDRVGSRRYKTGVDHGVLYMPDLQGAYSDGVAWSGLVNVTESPSGAEPNKQYADNIEYLNLFSAEMFAATIEAFTYPDEFALYNGLAVPTPGVTIGQQPRKTFGFAYRTLLGDDVRSTDLGYELHLVYGAKASPSEQANTTVNDTPEAMNLSWSISTTPVIVDGMKPTSIVTINSTQVDPTILAAVETILYGSVGVDPAMPLPDVIISMFEAGVTIAHPTKPSFDGYDTITIPTVTGIAYYVADVVVPAGALTITEDTFVEARPTAGYVIGEGDDSDWAFDFVAGP